MSVMIQEIIRRHGRICADHLSGATTLLVEILDLFRGLLKEETPGDKAATIHRFASDFIQCHPSMAQVINLCRDLVEGPADLRLMDETLAAWQERIDRERNETVSRAAVACAPYNRILTVSHSRLVAESILAMALAPEVIVGESRPMNEGVILANYLQERGKDVTLAVDAALPGLVEEGDAVMIGADCLTHEFLVNKTGTLALVLACRAKDFPVPVFALCPRSKYLSPGRSIHYQIYDQPPEELGHPVQEGVRVLNRYFEQVPLFLISHVVQEQDVLSPAEFLAHLEEDPDV